MRTVSRKLYIGGMTCINCQNKIQDKLKLTKGIERAKVSYDKGTAEITYDRETISLDDIIDLIESLGYEALTKAPARPDSSRTAGLLVIIATLYVLLQRSELLNYLVPDSLADNGMGYGMLFVVGLLTSVHCVAMCGGICLSQCIAPNEREKKNRLSVFIPSFFYNLGRVISYAAIGFLLGLAGMLLGGGGKAGLPVFVQGILKLIAGTFMVIMGINMLGIFPQLRRLQPRLPKRLANGLFERKKSGRGPFITGLINGLMPCGPLQSMQIIALAAGNPFVGGLSMLCFGLGTVPLMMGLGAFVSALGKKFTKSVMSAGAVLVVVLGLAMFSQGMNLSGFLLPVPSAGSGAQASSKAQTAAKKDGVQIVNSTLTRGRYPNITVQAGVPVRWIIDAPAGSINGCNYRMLIKEYGIEHSFEEGENIIEFTPDKAGTVRYTCWMGMIRGSIFVVDGNKNGADGGKGGGTGAQAGEQSFAQADVPQEANCRIPADEMAIAQTAEAENGNAVQKVSMELTERGFEPAVIVVEADRQVLWDISVSRTGQEETTLLVPVYSSALSLAEGENELYLYPTESFDISTGDHKYYAYVKVVEDIGQIDEEAIKKEVEEYKTWIYPASTFEIPQTGGSCCG